MFFLGHIGIGTWLSRPWRGQGRDRAQTLPVWPVVLGTLLPDLIDKPLYYGWSWIQHAQGPALGLISGTRTFGHTVLLLLVIVGVAYGRRSKVGAALALGIATHLLLDQVSDSLFKSVWHEEWLVQPNHGPTFAHALFFPFLGWEFPYARFDSLASHLKSGSRTVTLGGEVLGLALILWQVWIARNLRWPRIQSFWRKSKTAR